ncbi:Cytidylate kinase [hydrothermal vent metagenome]|uniref:(d)CMP kinase n=1 Tax=hydrothermal vent metagenome TaxID=652676 RepID=A0A1W1C8Z2_9ZZZZ
MNEILTIDGPSGVGKGTVATIIAKKLDWNILDSGAIYRALALDVIKRKIALDDKQNIIKIAKNLDLKFEIGNDLVVPILNNTDVSKKLRTQECGEVASQLAPIKEVREALLQRQRAFAKNKNLVADGRDMGTVVFKNAQTKIFLTASAEIRAKRRLKQLDISDNPSKIQKIVLEINQRDERDMNRSESPLKPAEDAHIIDTAHLTINEVVEKIMRLMNT